MKITRLKATRANPDRVRIELDGDRRLTLAAEIVQREGLAVGTVLDQDRLADLEARDARYRALEDALRLLSFRARSREELRRRLHRRDYGEADIDACLDRLEEQGYIDDAGFARSFVRDRLRLRPRGRHGLQRELRSRGVARETARRAIEAVFADEAVDEAALAVEEAERWVRRKGGRAGADPRADRRRLYGFLARRGFDSDAIRRAIDRTLGN